MANMGITQSQNYKYVNYCSVQHGIHYAVLIHAMDIADETLLIRGTLTASQEVECINLWIAERNFDKEIIIYSYSNMELEALLLKKQRLRAYGFMNVNIYIGGMFEWLLLHDIFGATEFPVDGLATNDILKYSKPVCST